MRRSLLYLVVFAAFVNAVPAVQQLCPPRQGPVNDELMGSGRETDDELSGARPKLLATKQPRRLIPSDPVKRAILAAERDLRYREPELGALIDLHKPAIRRDDAVGAMIWADNAILFNRAYVASLSRDQLYQHLWQIGAVLTTPL